MKQKFKRIKDQKTHIMHKVYSLKFVMTKMWTTTTKCKKIVISLISNTYKKKLQKQKINNEKKMDLEKYEKIKTLE